MNLMSKSVSYKESTISKIPVVMRELKTGASSVAALYGLLKDHFSDLSDFLETLDCLYALGELDIDEEKGAIFSVN